MKLAYWYRCRDCGKTERRDTFDLRLKCECGKRLRFSSTVVEQDKPKPEKPK